MSDLVSTGFGTHLLGKVIRIHSLGDLERLPNKLIIKENIWIGFWC